MPDLSLSVAAICLEVALESLREDPPDVKYAIADIETALDIVNGWRRATDDEADCR